MPPSDLPASWLVDLHAVVEVDDCATRKPPRRTRRTRRHGVGVRGRHLGNGNAGRRQGRRIISLIPDHLIVVVEESRIVELVPEAISRLDAMATQTWISGPSATSDIELERIEGVHGPRVLDVIIVRAT